MPCESRGTSCKHLRTKRQETVRKGDVKVMVGSEGRGGTPKTRFVVFSHDKKRYSVIRERTRAEAVYIRCAVSPVAGKPLLFIER